MLGHNDEANSDMAIAARLGLKEAQEYLNNRGVDWKQYS